MAVAEANDRASRQAGAIEATGHRFRQEDYRATELNESQGISQIGHWGTLDHPGTGRQRVDALVVTLDSGWQMWPTGNRLFGEVSNPECFPCKQRMISVHHNHPRLGAQLVSVQARCVERSRDEAYIRRASAHGLCELMQLPKE